MKYDCVIIGAGISGLTAASLLAKRGLSVAVCEQSSKPGGSCGMSKRSIDDDTAVFDQGPSMLFGFNKECFKVHRFLFNCLEESFYVIGHEKLYAKKFYYEIYDMYNKVIGGESISFIKHPIAYIKFLLYMNMSAKQMLMKHLKEPEIIDFFDNLTSTYCYVSVSEAPAILATVMFIDNHIGSSRHPAGSTLFLAGILEKVIEEYNGLMLYDSHVKKIIFNNAKASGVLLSDGSALIAENVICSGTVWNLYEIKAQLQGLFYCGESTTAGIATANAVLKRTGIKPYKWDPHMKDHIVELDKPVKRDWIYEYFPVDIAKIIDISSECMYCEEPACCSKDILDVPGIMRRASCGNIIGAYKIASESFINSTEQLTKNCRYEADPSEVIEMIFEAMDESL